VTTHCAHIENLDNPNVDLDFMGNATHDHAWVRLFIRVDGKHVELPVLTLDEARQLTACVEAAVDEAETTHARMILYHERKARDDS